MSEEMIQDLSTEGIAIGMLLNKPKLFEEYLELINSEYDFSDESLRFLYNLLLTTYLNNTIINETSFNIEISKMDQESQDFYKSLGGFKVYKRLSNVAVVQEDFKKIYTKLKTFNLLRELNDKGFSVHKNISKLIDKTPDQILKAYEMQLTKAGSYIKGITDSVRLGDDIEEVYENLKIEPDIGLQIPFPIINSMARGWRTSKLYASAMHSGVGKSREVIYMLAHTSVIGQTKVLMIVNEQEKQEIDLMLLTCISNIVFSPKYGFMVDEDEIASGTCTGKKDQMVKDAAKFIKERSKIQFMETNIYDFDSLKIMLKKHKLRGYNYAVIDTFKAMRGQETKGMADWLQFVYTSERLKRIIGSEAKGGLDMGLWLTMQLTDESKISKVLNSNSLATGKQVKHNLDFLKMSRILDWKDKDKIKLKIQMVDNPFNGQIQSLDKHKEYYITFLDKNRGGKGEKYIISEVDRGKMIFKELGWAVFNSNEEEKAFVEKV